MARTKTILGKVPIGRGAYSNNTEYYKENTVTLYGMSFRAISDKFRGYAPAKIDGGGNAVLQNTDKWELLSGHPEAYNNNKEVEKLNQRVDSQDKTIKAYTEKVDKYKPIVINGDVVNTADEEDITSDENNLLKLKDRPATDGMGYVILRKNKTFAEQVTQPNTIYEIRYDFDLNRAEVEIPENCVLKFEGGSLSNGNVIGNFKVKDMAKEQLQLGVFADGFNMDMDVVTTSNIGMIPNDASASIYNYNILAKAVAKKKDIFVDDVYYINGDGLDIDYDLLIEGVNKAKLFITGTLVCPLKGSSIMFKNCEFVGGYVISTKTPIDYIITSIIIKNCTFIDNTRVVSVAGQDIDYSLRPFGISKMVVENCNISSQNSCFVMPDIVFKDGMIFRGNNITQFRHIVVNLATTNEYVYPPKNRDYQGDVIVENNIAKGMCTQSVTYQTLCLAEVKRLIYRNNIVSDSISVEGPTYDCYGSSTEYICEGNTFRNVVQLPTEGLTHYSEIFKSKGGGGVKIARNNYWFVDFNECRRLVQEQLGIAYTDEYFSTINYITIFGHTAVTDKVEFTSNKITINNGNLEGAPSSRPIREIVLTDNILNISNGEIISRLFSWWGPETKKIVIKNNGIYTENKNYMPLLGYSNTSSNNPELTLICEGNDTSVPLYMPLAGDGGTIRQLLFDNNTYNNYGEETPQSLYMECNPSQKSKVSISRIPSSHGIKYYRKDNCILDINVPVASSSEYIMIYLGFGYEGDLCVNDDVYRIRMKDDAPCLYDSQMAFIKAVGSSYADMIRTNTYVVNAIYRTSNTDGLILRIRVLSAPMVITIAGLNTNAYPLQTQVSKGITDNRPSSDVLTEGSVYFDTTLKKPIWWNGTKWVDATGAEV